MSVTDHGGKTFVVARAGSVVGSTALTLLLRKRRRDPASSLPDDPEALFANSPTGGAAPELVYPNDGVMLPPNLGAIEVHVRPAAGDALFELSLGNDASDVRVYFSCAHPFGGGCIYTTDATVWRWLAATNRGGDPVTLHIRASDGKGGPVGTSNPVALAIARDDLAGGLYYWTTSNATAIMRVDFAAGAPAAQKFAGPELAGGVCIGCHALSHDGTRMVAEAGGQNDGRQLLVDVAHGTLLAPFGSTPLSVFESWEPSGQRYVGVYGDRGATDFDLLLFDGSSAAKLGAIAGTGSAMHPADHPDWSPDGKRIAYTQIGIAGTTQRMWQGAIRVVSSSDGIAWSPPVDVVPSAPGKNRYYPAFSPDGSTLVYDESTCPPGQFRHKDCDADTDPSATLFVVRPQPGATPTALARANAPGRTDGGKTALTNSFPKWCPFLSGGGELGGKLGWITFSSTRNYGLRPPPPSPDVGVESSVGTLVWMAAIDLAAVGAGDPSWAAFALPFQDLSTSNHIAQWTTRVVPIE